MAVPVQPARARPSTAEAMTLLNDFTLLLHGLEPESKYWAAALYQNTPPFCSWLCSFPRHCQKRQLALTTALRGSPQEPEAKVPKPS